MARTDHVRRTPEPELAFPRGRCRGMRRVRGHYGVDMPDEALGWRMPRKQDSSFASSQFHIFSVAIFTPQSPQTATVQGTFRHFFCGGLVIIRMNDDLARRPPAVHSIARLKYERISGQDVRTARATGWCGDAVIEADLFQRAINFW